MLGTGVHTIIHNNSTDNMDFYSTQEEGVKSQIREAYTS
jgi:hypothetical protein